MNMNKSALLPSLMPFCGVTCLPVRQERRSNLIADRLLSAKGGSASGGRSFARNDTNDKWGFTFIEILIVIAIIAILAATIFPNFVSFDVEARVTSTKSSLESIRTSINLFRAKQGHYPASLEDIANTFYLDAGVKQSFLRKVPPEMISSSKGNNNVANQTANEPLSGDGGWVYITDTAEVKVNIKGRLGKKWSQFAEEEPSEW